MCVGAHAVRRSTWPRRRRSRCFFSQRWHDLLLLILYDREGARHAKCAQTNTYGSRKQPRRRRTSRGGGNLHQKGADFFCSPDAALAQIYTVLQCSAAWQGTLYSTVVVQYSINSSTTVFSFWVLEGRIRILYWQLWHYSTTTAV